MKIFNTLTLEKEEIKSLKKEIGLYTCGPTVYDSAHIGNLRAYLCYDFLKRALLSDGFKVKHAMNITDVEDKTIKRSGGRKAEFEKLIRECEEKFWSDMAELNTLKPEIITRATAYIEKIVLFIKDLLDKDFAYKTADGSIYFSIEKFKEYGKLSKLEKRELKPGARVSQDEYDKENPADFALWKAWDESDGEIYWDPTSLKLRGVGAEVPKGRPGWHIECSVMSQDVLGDTIDIHAGGIDLIFPHHENEIAQSEARTGKKFAEIWFHNEHLLADGKKMSKSLGNFYILDDIKSKGFSPLDFRYLVFGAHYRSKLNFTWEALEAAKNARERLKRFVADNADTEGEVCEIYSTKFNLRLADDLNTPEALAIVWDLVKDEKKSMGKKIATLKKLDEKILGFGLFEKEEIPAPIIALAEERKSAREAKDFDKSDELREKILNLGWKIEDSSDNNYKLSK